MELLIHAGIKVKVKVSKVSKVSKRGPRLYMLRSTWCAATIAGKSNDVAPTGRKLFIK